MFDHVVLAPTPPPRRWTVVLGIVGTAMILGAMISAGVSIADAQRQVAEREQGFEPTAERLLNSSGTAAEAALDAISGGRADLVLDTWDAPYCPEDALACVGPDTDVHIRASDGILTDAQLVRLYGTDWERIMRHEYAHVVQYRWYADLVVSPEYRRLFADIPAADPDPTIDYAIEHSADCMALAMWPTYVPVYAGVCTAEQVEFAATMWDGSFRG